MLRFTVEFDPATDRSEMSGPPAPALLIADLLLGHARKLLADRAAWEAGRPQILTVEPREAAAVLAHK